MKHCIFGLALVATSLPFAAHADTLINLNATPSTDVYPAIGTPNNLTPNYFYTTTLGAGTYSVSVIGTAQGGLYNAWNQSTPSTNPTWGERTGVDFSGMSFGYANGDPSYSYPNADQTLFGANSYTTAATALSAAEASGPFVFTLANATQVSFYIPDQPNGIYPGFSDNTGGVSLDLRAVTPEPSSIALLGTGLLSLGGVIKRKVTA